MVNSGFLKVMNIEFYFTVTASKISSEVYMKPSNKTPVNVV